MTRLSPVAAALLIVVATFGALPVVGVTAGETAPLTATADATAAVQNEPNGTLAPGEQLAAVVGVQQAGIQGEVRTRAFGQRVAGAATNTSKAGVVGEEVERLRERLQRLREERRELRAAHRNGSIGNGQYRARLANIHARTRAAQREINATGQVARGLPARALEARGVDATAIRTLRSEAQNLTGPEVAAIARSVAGNAADGAMGPGERGPPDSVADSSVPGQGPPDNRNGAPANESQGDRGGESNNRGQNDGDRSGQSGGRTDGGSDSAGSGDGGDSSGDAAGTESGDESGDETSD